MRYQRLAEEPPPPPVIVNAWRWFTNGDHPNDESVMKGDGHDTPFLTEGKVVGFVRGDKYKHFPVECAACHKPRVEHGVLNASGGRPRLVCPGDYIMDGEDIEAGVEPDHLVFPPDLFEKIYGPYIDDEGGMTFNRLSAECLRRYGSLQDEALQVSVVEWSRVLAESAQLLHDRMEAYDRDFDGRRASVLPDEIQKARKKIATLLAKTVIRAGIFAERFGVNLGVAIAEEFGLPSSPEEPIREQSDPSPEDS